MIVFLIREMLSEFFHLNPFHIYTFEKLNYNFWIINLIWVICLYYNIFYIFMYITCLFLTLFFQIIMRLLLPEREERKLY